MKTAIAAIVLALTLTACGTTGPSHVADHYPDVPAQVGD